MLEMHGVVGGWGQHQEGAYVSKDACVRKTKGSQLEGIWAGKADSGPCCASGIFQ